MICRISSIVLLMLLTLQSTMFSTNALPSAVTSEIISPKSMSSCNCIRAKDCLIYTKKRQLNSMIERMLNVACDATLDTEPLICCPTNTRKTTNERNLETEIFNEHSRNMKERWVWDRRPKTPNDNNRETTSINIENKFLDGPQHDFITTNLIDDYFDWKTQRNCPPILYKEKQNFHAHFDSQHHPLIYDQYDFHLHSHSHPHPHDHFGFKHDHRHDFDNNHGDAITYPDAQHKFWHTHVWTEPEVSSTNNKGQRTTPLPKKATSILTTTLPTTTLATATQRPIISSPNCGITFSKRIIGGIEALPGEFPWITRIAYLNTTDNTIAYRCSGSFITDLHIITAAHCISNLDGSLNLSHIRLVDLGTSNEQAKQNIFKISETFVHPNYNTPRRANDVGIIKIIRPTDVPVNYGTICLPTLTNFGSLIGGTGIVAGWSNNEGSTQSDLSVRYLRLPIINNTECSNRYDMFRQGFSEKITIDIGMICTQGQANGSDVCRGDSGGPLMDDGSSSASNREGRYTLIGIVAFGPICGFTNLVPGVYMRVSEYIQWITDSIR